MDFGEESKNTTVAFGRSIFTNSFEQGMILARDLPIGHIASMLGAEEIDRMTLTERLQTMELLWRSISVSPEKVASPDWHQDVLSARLAKVEEGRGAFLTISELKARLRENRS